MTRFKFMLLVLFIPGFSCAQDNTVTLESQVKGNQEQPNVLSIVPWKEATDRRPIEQSIEADIGRLFQHLDKKEFVRQQRFYKYFQQVSADTEKADLHISH